MLLCLDFLPQTFAVSLRKSHSRAPAVVHEYLYHSRHPRHTTSRHVTSCRRSTSTTSAAQPSRHKWEGIRGGTFHSHSRLARHRRRRGNEVRAGSGSTGRGRGRSTKHKARGAGHGPGKREAGSSETETRNKRDMGHGKWDMGESWGSYRKREAEPGSERA